MTVPGFIQLMFDRFEVNFGQRVPWYPPPAGFVYPDQFMPMERIRGMVAPSSKAECEVSNLGEMY